MRPPSPAESPPWLWLGRSGAPKVAPSAAMVSTARSGCPLSVLNSAPDCGLTCEGGIATPTDATESSPQALLLHLDPPPPLWVPSNEVLAPGNMAQVGTVWERGGAARPVPVGCSCPRGKNWAFAPQQSPARRGRGGGLVSPTNPPRVPRSAASGGLARAQRRPAAHQRLPASHVVTVQIGRGWLARQIEMLEPIEVAPSARAALTQEIHHHLAIVTEPKRFRTSCERSRDMFCREEGVASICSGQWRDAEPSALLRCEGGVRFNRTFV